MKIAIGGDHAGFPLKGPIIELLKTWGHEVTDYGTHSTEPVDFPDIARLVCEPKALGVGELRFALAMPTAVFLFVGPEWEQPSLATRPPVSGRQFVTILILRTSAWNTTT